MYDPTRNTEVPDKQLCQAWWPINTMNNDELLVNSRIGAPVITPHEIFNGNGSKSMPRHHIQNLTFVYNHIATFPMNILQKYLDNAAICIVRPNWSTFRLWNSYLDLVALGHLKTPQIAHELTEATLSYKNLTTTLWQTHELQVVILDQALIAFPSAWEPAARQQACDTNATAM